MYAKLLLRVELNDCPQVLPAVRRQQLARGRTVRSASILLEICAVVLLGMSRFLRHVPAAWNEACGSVDYKYGQGLKML